MMTVPQALHGRRSPQHALVEAALGDQPRSGDRELGDYYQVTGCPRPVVGSGVEHFELDGW
ncbi:hypothetical protein QJS66_23645 (plasmid) [Kocuria rhizophila]|nr:hypothetical protein QJS66_23645 [Kocuria rhizophila]